MAWLTLCVFVIGCGAFYWLTEAANPYRREALIGVTIGAFYSWPALLAAAVLSRMWDENSFVIERRTAKGLIVTGTAIVAITYALSFSK
ncbi:MAG TPA: hypothetical protein VFK88_12560 [Gallionella sp.]|nr:hypothetical protein [Gallionella sp.]